MNILILPFVLFILAVIVIELLLYAYRIVRHPERVLLRKRIKTLASLERRRMTADILKENIAEESDPQKRFLERVPGLRSFIGLTQQANVQYTPGMLALAMFVLALAGAVLALLGLHQPLLVPALAGLLGGLPLLYLKIKKQERATKFQKQLPEAMEMIARSLRAGHAFTTGMKLVADEFRDPLGPEFAATLDEINFGVSVPEALKSMAGRIDCPELRFFVVSVILQRETGGNLAEIIENIAGLIRERFKLKGKIKALSAEGRLSAIILAALPFGILGLLKYLNPSYMDLLFTEPAGRAMAGVALFMLLLGLGVIRRMIKIKV